MCVPCRGPAGGYNVDSEAPVRILVEIGLAGTERRILQINCQSVL
jgi:hypothetical protein